MRITVGPMLLQQVNGSLPFDPSTITGLDDVSLKHACCVCGPNRHMLSMLCGGRSIAWIGCAHYLDWDLRKGA